MTRQRLLISAAIAGCVFASQTLAEEHVVIVTGFAYFPDTVYVAPGDSIRFVNKSGVEQLVTAADGSWIVGPFANDTEATLAITPATHLDYHGHDVHRPGAAISAAFTFAPPPLG